MTWLRRSLRGVVSQGTAAPAFSGFPLDAHPVAGKTGTAQVQGKAPTSWFASMAPAGDPKYVVVAMVTEGGAGGGNAAPVARGIYETIFGVGTRAAFPPDGPPQDLPRVTGVRR
jgi:penicillin-binding protein 2